MEIPESKSIITEIKNSLVILISVLSYKEYRSHHSVLTSKKINKLKNQWFFDVSEKWAHRTAVSKVAEENLNCNWWTVEAQWGQAWELKTPGSLVFGGHTHPLWVLPPLNLPSSHSENRFWHPSTRNGHIQQVENQ